MQRWGLLLPHGVCDDLIFLQRFLPTYTLFLLVVFHHSHKTPWNCLSFIRCACWRAGGRGGPGVAGGVVARRGCPGARGGCIQLAGQTWRGIHPARMRNCGGATAR